MALSDKFHAGCRGTPKLMVFRAETDLNQLAVHEARRRPGSAQQVCMSTSKHCDRLNAVRIAKLM